MVVVSDDGNVSAVKLARSPNSGEVVSVRNDVSARGELGGSASMGAAFSVCAIDDCTVANGASLEVGPLSGFVDVDVIVRYNAVCKAKAAPTSPRLVGNIVGNIVGETHSAVALHFQTPKPGKRSSTSPAQLSNLGIKVEPLGSSVVLTSSVCIPPGKSG